MTNDTTWEALCIAWMCWWQQRAAEQWAWGHVAAATAALVEADQWAAKAEVGR